MKGAGGTSGGTGMFLAGLAMVVGGGYILLQRVTVSSGFWEFGGRNAFGLSMVPLLAGIGVLFFNGKSVIGWLLTGAGSLIIVTGLLANLRVYFGPSSLFDTIMMFGLMAGGIGLVAKSLRPVPERKGAETP
jgi:hypothetical protein